METQTFLMIHNGSKFESISIYTDTEQATKDYFKAAKTYPSEYEIRILSDVSLIKALNHFFNSNV